MLLDPREEISFTITTDLQVLNSDQPDNQNAHYRDYKLLVDEVTEITIVSKSILKDRCTEVYGTEQVVDPRDHVLEDDHCRIFAPELVNKDCQELSLIDLKTFSVL